MPFDMSERTQSHVRRHPTHVIHFHFPLCRGGAVIRMSCWAETNFVIAKFEELPRHETLTQHVIPAPSRALR